MENPDNMKLLGQTFQKNKKAFVDYFIMKTRFRDTKDRKTLEKRREDWGKDLNMNLIKAKVIRSTHYFDQIYDDERLALLKALETEPGMRDDEECKTILKYVRSMSFFKPYENFQTSDFLPVL